LEVVRGELRCLRRAFTIILFRGGLAPAAAGLVGRIRQLMMGRRKMAEQIAFLARILGQGQYQGASYPGQ